MANIKDKLNNIKNALFGHEVRGSIHDGIEAINEEVENTTSRQNVLENTFEQLTINAGNSNAEIVAARVEADGTTHKKLGDRLNKVDSQIKDVEKNKADKQNVRFSNVNITLNDCDSELISAIQGGGDTTFNLESIPRDKSVDRTKTTFDIVNSTKTKNLFDKFSATYNKYIDPNGNVSDIPDGIARVVSDYIEVEPNTIYTASENISHFALYTSEHTLIQYYYDTVNQVKIIDDSTVKFIRFTTPVENVDKLSFEKGSDSKSGRPYCTPIIDDNSIDVSKLNFEPLEKVRTRNLFNKNSAKIGKYVASYDGRVSDPTDGNSYAASDYIQVVAGEEYCISHPSQTAFYDSEKNFISGMDLPTTPFTVPNEAVYMRTTIPTYIVSINDFQIEKGNVSTPYVPYYDIPDKIIKSNHLSDEVRDLLDKIRVKAITINCCCITC